MCIQVAEPDIVKASCDADILVMVVPHQFINGICAQIKGKIKLNAIAISLIKVWMRGRGFYTTANAQGITVGDDNTIKLISKVIADKLNIKTAVLMGANLAHEVAAENFCEATIGEGRSFI